MNRYVWMLVALLFSSSALAADPRIYTYVYDKSKVFPLYTLLGEAFLLQFEEDEFFDNDHSALGMGDSAAWSVAVRANGVLMKPTGVFPNTNLIIVTNKRTYAFEIVASTKEHRPTYIVRFRYPDTEARLREERRQRAIQEAKAARERDKLRLAIYGDRNKPVFNPDYSWIGSNSKTSSKHVSLLKPTAAWDDGRFTHLQYDTAASLPNFYKVNPDGTEALINSHIDPEEKNTVILQEVVRMFRVRLGEEVIEIVNNAYVVPKFNTTGTGDFDSLRLRKTKK